MTLEPACPWWRAAAAGCAATLLVLATASPAGAHAHCLRIVPSDGAVVVTAPTEVELTFDETVQEPSTVLVTGPGGRRVDVGETRVLDDTASVDVSASDPGAYVVAYRVLSGDGHPITGRSRFTVSPGAPASGGAAASSPTAGHCGHSAGHTGSESGGLSAASSGVVAGAIAGLGLLGGIALLTVRRREVGGTRRSTTSGGQR